LELEEGTVRAGHLVHFSISGAEGNVTYEFEVGDREILKGTGAGEVSGAFSMPDLGEAARTVTVEGEIRGSDKRKKVKHKLEYLGSALPVAGPPAPIFAPAAPAVVPQAAPLPAPTYTTGTNEATSPAPVVTPPLSRRPRESRERRAIESPPRATRDAEQRRRAHGRHDRRRRHPATGKTRSRKKRPAHRIGPLFDGIPEPEAGARPDHRGGFSSLNAIAPHSLAATATGDGAYAAVVVPGLLGLAAHLASRGPRSGPGATDAL
jgi:hypothetical protein